MNIGRLRILTHTGSLTGGTGGSTAVPFTALLPSHSALLGLLFQCHPLSSSVCCCPLISLVFRRSFGELLSYLFLSRGLERKQTGSRTETSSRSTQSPLRRLPLLRFLLSLTFHLSFYPSVFNGETASVSHRLPECFRAALAHV